MKGIYKPTVLLCLSYYLPGYKGGGPIRTIANLVDTLGSEFNFKIITCDRDLGGQQPYDSVIIDSWNAIGNAQVYYLSQQSKATDLRNLIKNTQYDILYLNSFFSKIFSISPLMMYKFGKIKKTPIIVAPRGEFSDGAMQIKWLKKAIFIVVAKIFMLYKNVFWHASTVHEQHDIKKYFKNAQHIHVAADLPATINFFASRDLPEKIKKIKICFLSRICIMKNLDFVLSVLAKVKTPVELSIYGPQESATYWQQCQKLIDQLPVHIQVVYHGAIPNDHVKSTIQQHDLFFVPTRGENYGHVFVEALAAGVPVLLSDQTPWQQLRDKGVGWDLPLDNTAEFVDVIERWANSDIRTRMASRQACQSYAQEIVQDIDNLNANRRLFLDCVL